MGNDLLDLFLNGNCSESSEQSLTKYSDIKDYHLERNLSFTLPFNFSKHSAKEKYEKKFEISTVDKNNIITKQVEITSLHGPLNGVDQDVLLCLMSLAKSQGTDTPHFTLMNICNILQMPTSSTKNIRESIKKMSDVKLVFKDTFIGTEGKIQKEYITRLINNAEFNEVIRKNSPINEYHYVSFDKKVIDNIMRDFTISIPREFYNKLPYGGPKRLFQMLEANWMNTKQPVFLTKVEDLASILGINSEIRFVKRKIKEYLEALQENDVKLEFSFHGKDPMMLRVTYEGIENESSLEKECREVFEKLLIKFTPEYLNKYKVKDYLSFWSMKHHKDSDYIYIGKFKKGVKRIYLVIEHLLEQYKDGPAIKNLHALIEKTYSEILINEYSSCFLEVEKKVQAKTVDDLSITASQSIVDDYIKQYPEEYENLKSEAKKEFDEVFSDFEGINFTTYFNSKLLSAAKDSISGVNT